MGRCGETKAFYINGNTSFKSFIFAGICNTSFYCSGDKEKIQDYTHELWRGKLTPASVNSPDHMALARSSGSQDHGGGLVVSNAEALETDPSDGSSSFLPVA